MTEQEPKAAAEAGEAAEKPAHRGPPIVIAEEVLNERGEETAAQLANALGALALESAGRLDTPWASTLLSCTAQPRSAAMVRWAWTCSTSCLPSTGLSASR